MPQREAAPITIDIMSHPATTTPSPQQRFFALLKRDILKLDLAELDFGIYRILNYRRAQVLAFLDETLPGKIQQWVSTLEKVGGRTLADTEQASIYYHLHTFFSRYWDDGDFIPRARRGGTAAYAVPYNGQDTHFHWATKGSHYVKSGELFNRYAYKDGSTEVRFTIERADTEKDNAKGAQKFFFPASITVDGDSVQVGWQWRAPTEAENKRYKAKNAQRSANAGDTESADAEDEDSDSNGESATGNSLQERVLDAWARGLDYKAAIVPASLDREKLASNARRYVRKNSSDFFVHPQLGSFLTGELDVYLKHEFVQVWDAADSELPRIRAKFKLVRDIATDLITFLDQIERFQATLFEKRKFVLQADYLVQCSWLLREAGAAGQALVDEAAASPDQATEWGQWVGESTVPASASAGASTRKKSVPAARKAGADLLQRFPHLPLNTKHFSSDFKARALACFDDIEAALGGELFHADNYAALRTMEPAYRERVKCIYIDPPYNTGVDDFPYKDGYPSSSWLAMIGERCNAAFRLLRNDAAFYMSLDDNEIHRSRALFDNAPTMNRLATFVRRRRMATGMKDDPISPDHEYVLAYARRGEKVALRGFGLDPEDYTLQDARSSYRSTDLSVGMGRDLRPKQFYSITNPRTGKSFTASESRVWRFEHSSMAREIAAGNIIWPDDETGRKMERPRYKTRLPASDVAAWRPISTWLLRETEKTGPVRMGYRAGLNQEATRELSNLLPEAPQIYPKPTSLIEDLAYITVTENGNVLDFFAGSGTTGHAVINLNREDGGARKFLLVEQGEYFDTVTLPRIAKVMTAPEWKDGKPKDSVVRDDAGDTEHWSRRTLPLVRVLRLERYEDSLNALDLSQAVRSANAAQTDLSLVAQDADETLLRYWLADDASGSAVTLNTQALADPFAYQLTLHEPTGERRAQVDLLETARLLLGLVPKRQREVKDASGARHQLLEAMLAADVAKAKTGAKPVLLWLRVARDERDEEAAQAERLWLIDTVQKEFQRTLGDYAQILHNRHALWLPDESGVSIDALLAERMMERA